MLVESQQDLELWGGIESTCNRVNSEYMDQLKLSGHDSRLDDLNLIADLGIRTLRYPILWERTAPRGVARANWSWPDARLARLRELGIEPIVGLVHHGSGPPHTNLADASFATGLAEYAAAVAERYPGVVYYTPVNEPLTTARFSGLYGHWFPHARSSLEFAQMLLNQCKATVLAMRAIRKVNPDARLVQTDDLGKTFSTPLLRYQAEFENERRWVTFDLLMGRLRPDTIIWQFFRKLGISDGDLAWFVDNPCPPEVLGVNYYVVSERLLDERVARYPASLHGGNGRHRYADIEAVRVRGEELAGWSGLMREAWQRFGVPLAITEVHLDCHREGQMNWLLEAWNSALELRAENIDVRAVTAWSLLGAYNWNTLVTRDVGHYESGAFDCGGGAPRPTALARLIRELTSGEKKHHPVLHSKGWWRRSDRLLHRPVFTNGRIKKAAVSGTPNDKSNDESGDPILIVGATGTLGDAFTRACRERDLRNISTTRHQLDITRGEQINNFIKEHRPWAVINAAGYVRVDEAEDNAEQCRRENVVGATNLAKACAAAGVPLLTFSSDLVFSGSQTRPYLESDDVAPLNEYGRSKADSEREVLEACPKVIVIRTSAFFGPWDQYNFLTAALSRLAKGLPVKAADDWFVSPTYVPDLVNRCLDLLIDAESGVWHLANEGATTWADFAREAATRMRLDHRAIQACSGTSLGLRAQRPNYSVLGSRRGRLLPRLSDAIDRYCVARSDLATSSSGEFDSLRRGKEASFHDTCNSANRATSASAVGT